MNKRIGYFLFVVFFSFFLIIGTLEVQADNDESPRTFAISDTNPYPGKLNATVRDHPVNTLFYVYIYIVNHGGQLKTNDSAKDITVTLTTDTGSIIGSKTVVPITDGEGYAKVEFSWPENVYVTLKITGTIFKNGNESHKDTVATESNYFWIGDPVPTPPTSGVGQILWEKEVF